MTVPYRPTELNFEAFLRGDVLHTSFSLFQIKVKLIYHFIFTVLYINLQSSVFRSSFKP